jgi:endoglucanase
MRLGSLLAALALGGGMAAVTAQQLPLHTQSRWIMDSTGARVKFRCINWMGHGEVNIPEGLNKQPVATIADFIADHGFNCVRLTYSIDHALNPTVSVQDSFTAAAAASGVAVDVMDGMYAGVVAQNPDIANGTQQDAFAAVIKALWDRQVMTVLDNHVSKAKWCCKCIAQLFFSCS